MMRGPGNWAVAVRTPSGEIAQVSQLDRLCDGAPPRVPPADHPRRDGARRVARDRFPRARDLRELRGAGGEPSEAEERPPRSRPSSRAARSIFAFAVAIGFAVMLFKVTPGADHRTAADQEHRLVRDRRRADPRDDLRRVPLAHLAAARSAARVPVPRRRAQGDQRVRGGGGARAGDRAALLAHPPALRHRVPPLGDGDRRVRLRVLRPARVVLADRDAHPAAAGDRRARVRVDPLRRASTRATAC